MALKTGRRKNVRVDQYEPLVVPPKSTHILAHAIPLDDRVIIRRDDPITETQGGILLPDSAKVRMQRGTVVAVGPGKPGADGVRIRPDFGVGTRVLFSPYAGDSMNRNDFVSTQDEEYLIMRAEDVVAVIADDDAPLL